MKAEFITINDIDFKVSDVYECFPGVEHVKIDRALSYVQAKSWASVEALKDGRYNLVSQIKFCLNEWAYTQAYLDQLKDCEYVPVRVIPKDYPWLYTHRPHLASSEEYSPVFYAFLHSEFAWAAADQYQWEWSQAFSKVKGYCLDGYNFIEHHYDRFYKMLITSKEC